MPEEAGLAGGLLGKVGHSLEAATSRGLPTRRCRCSPSPDSCWAALVPVAPPLPLALPGWPCWARTCSGPSGHPTPY